jgi:hypothetical protein
MKTIAEMTDLEIAEKLMWIAAEFDSDSGDEYDADVLRWLAEAKRRLSTHPAQRIADLTGGVVTKNENGMWKLWPNDDLITAYGSWSANFVKVEHFILSLLPDDNRPWQESIYKPQVNVKNGGKDGGTSDE